MGRLNLESLPKLQRFLDLDVLSWDLEMSSVDETDLRMKDERILLRIKLNNLSLIIILLIEFNLFNLA
jgi:hypothetical protein